MSTITIRPVATHKDKIAFLKVPFPLYANDKNWVAPMFFERMEHLSEKKNPYFQHAKAQLFIAEKNGRPVGRISAQIDQLHLEKYKDDVGQFGFLEAENDPEIFASLFNSAADWLRSQGAKKIRGPFSFSINDESGLLIDGFETMPSMMMGHGTPYYQQRVEEQGFAKIKDLYAYEFESKSGLPPTLRKMVDRMMASGDLQLRTLNKKKMADDMDIIMRIFNDAWSDNWGFIPFTEAEVNLLSNNFKLLLDAKAVTIASWKGEPVAFCVAIANINEWFQGLNGKLLPFGWAKLAKRLIAGKSRSVRVPLMGVSKKFQNSAIGAGLALSVIRGSADHLIAKGVEHGEFSWILEDNLRMRHMLETMGSRIYKTYRIYEKAL